ncbi:MAG: hypothetical protein AB8B50_03130 [Pirellulaceae bacterium]
MTAPEATTPESEFDESARAAAHCDSGELAQTEAGKQQATRRVRSQGNRKSKRGKRDKGSGFYPDDFEPRRTLVDVLLLPFRVVNNFFGHWGFERILGSGLRSVLGIFSRVLRFDSARHRAVVSEGESSVVDIPSKKTMANPLWWVLWSVQFPWLWLVSRPFLGLVIAFPGILALSAIFLLIANGVRQPTTVSSSSYRKSVKRAVNDSDFDQARFFAMLAVRENPKSADDLFNRGIVEVEAGELVASRDFMKEAALGLNSERAAIWLAENAGDRAQIDRWDEKQKQDYIQWLEVALATNPTSVNTVKALADAQRSAGRLAEAYETLLTIEGNDSSIGLLLLVMENELGFPGKADQRAKSEIEKNEQLLKDVPGRVDTRINTAKMLVFLKKEEDAARLLKAGLKQRPGAQDEGKLRRSLADAYVLIANKIARQDRTARGLMQRLKLIQAAVGSDPSSPAVLDALTKVCAEAAASEDNEVAVLREAVVRGVSGDAAHFVLGTLALMEGNPKEALTHLEVAQQSTPNLPSVLNNLAYAMCQSEDADLERALELSNAAVRLTQGNPYALETRGQIYLKLEKWREAVVDLEGALEEAELRKLVRPGLALAYDNLGKPRIAKRHRDLHARGE